MSVQCAIHVKASDSSSNVCQEIVNYQRLSAV